MRPVFPLFCLMASCGGVQTSSSTVADAGNGDDVRACRPPAPPPTSTDGELPAWAVGDFYDDAPDLGDSVNLRIGPSGFEWTLGGCDVFVCTAGIVIESRSDMVIVGGRDGGGVQWMGGGGWSNVARATLHPADGGGLVSDIGDGGVVHWARGLRCGCGVPRACTCEDPFVFSQCL